MFKKNFIRFCNARKESPTYVCNQIGITAAAFSKWTDESVPRRATLMRIADYFGVTVDDLLADNTQKTPPASKELTEGEAKLLELFRAMPEDRQAAYLDLLAAALKIEQ